MRDSRPFTARPADAIWALTNGYSSEIRAQKPLIMLQAYVDDSASDEGDQRLFLAGYINTADKWIRFSDAWQEELDSAPSIKYLKMSEANYQAGQFWGWSNKDRDEKLRGLARVIRHFGPASIHSSISRREFKEIVSPVAPYGFNRPYFYCFQAIIMSLANSMLDYGTRRVPVDFIFDEQGGVGHEARFFYRLIRDAQPAAVRSILSSDPIFMDDKLVLPLQAADMLAWHVRRNHVDRPDAFQVPNFLSADGHHIASDLDAAYLKRIAKGYANIPGTQKLRERSAWQKTLLEVQRIEGAGGRPNLRSIRNQHTILYWKRRVSRILTRFLALFSRRS